MNLKIEYPSGHTTIILDEFFPTLQKRLRQLLKVIELDVEHEKEHINTLIMFFNEKIKELEAKRIESGKNYLDCRQKAVEQKTLFESKKKSNGVRLSKEELKQAEKELKYYKRRSKELLADYNKSEKQIQQLQRHLKLLNQRW